MKKILRYAAIGFAVFMGLIVLIGIFSDSSSKNTSKETSQSSSEEHKPNYSIAESSVDAENSKAVYKITLDSPVELDDIKAIGESFKNKHSDLKWVFVMYNLKEYPNLGLGCYALSNYEDGRPSLLEIQGSAKKDFEQTQKKSVSGKKVGDWINATSISPRIVFIDSLDKVYKKNVYKDGITKPELLVKVKDSYEYAGEKNSDVYKINSDNSLSVYNSTGALLLKYKVNN